MKFLPVILGLVLGLQGSILAQSNTEPANMDPDRKPAFSESKAFAPGKSIATNVKRPRPARTNPVNSGADDGDTIKINSSLVTIPVTVSDSASGDYISNLEKSDFRIFEDGVEQEIAYFGVSDKPITVILLIDTSPSTKYEIDEIQEAASVFVKQLKPQDRVEVIKFNEKIRVLTRATKKREKIFKAIGKARFDGGTSLYDAVEFSLEERLKKVNGRKAIVLFTDGVDTTSRNAFYDDNVGQVEKSDTVVFPIFYDTYLKEVRKKKRSHIRELAERKLGKMYLDDLASLSGGRVIEPALTPGGLNNAFKTIAEELSHQYSIGYYPIEEGKPGERKNLKVRIYRPGLDIRARDNYIVKER
ncbi:MAG: VWA domain-containing protein [Pyrinomonadaceae bacterium]|nr:VWA domain-containing protein [Pyrinomonadaceae bacterium]